MPDQISEEVSSSNKDKMDKIFEKIESGVVKLELGDEFSIPMIVITDQATSLKLINLIVLIHNHQYLMKNGEMFLLIQLRL
ncbi:hypothetical protein F9Y90_05445 (plasmid) [Borrelia miyamotoi]|uniref:Uncharacterized protein n=2 Tax=Borrelia miyamotoi TaxID=47466 RepID=A0A5P8AUJ7_9SPIR|nr:hypothetical protein [Borrelia miyamotoi]QFP42542.1 hypothetical protein F9Y90_05445 [Borrelia miyamotoi]WAZ72277.1 hypothetical protein O5404_04425 [Borrelia miyamotoi]WVI05272.1 hypothetical protein F9Y91_00120 [Borrelia miyamotoi]